MADSLKKLADGNTDITNSATPIQPVVRLSRR
jgi:hypothetical protein